MTFGERVRAYLEALALREIAEIQKRLALLEMIRRVIAAAVKAYQHQGNERHRAFEPTVEENAQR